MKRLLRIFLGTAIVVMPIVLGTYLWMWSDSESWTDTVGKFSWYLASGQWEKLDEY